MTQVVWFKRDLRVLDHAPLYHASQSGEILPLYIVEPFLFENETYTKRHLKFIYESLVDLKSSLKKHGLELHVFMGDALACFETLYDLIGTFNLHAHMEHGTEDTFKRDLDIHAFCLQKNITFHEYKVFGVNRGYGKKYRLRDFHAWVNEGIFTLPKQMNPYRLNTPFGIENLEQIRNQKAYGETTNFLIGGEIEAIKHAKAFFNSRYKKYKIFIHKPSKSILSSSLLSPYLAFGNLSIRMLHISTRKHLKETIDPFLKEQLKAFETRLYWHCHFIQRVESHPELNKVPWDKRLEGLRHDNDKVIKAFEDGKTGFPLVDAIMIALHKRGWVNFKQRAIVASFATNVLLIDWITVGHILQRLFIDYEPGIHWSQIQMQAGLNPYRHIPMYDIVKQTIKDDPNGDFIHEMIPSLKGLNIPELATPWLLDKNIYIEPIIDLNKAFKESKILLYNNKRKLKEADLKIDKSLTLFDE